MTLQLGAPTAGAGEEVLADVAAIVDGPLAIEPFIGPGGDREAALGRMRELNGAQAALAVERRQLAPQGVAEPLSTEDQALHGLEREMLQGEAAYLIGVLGLSSELGDQVPDIARAAQEMDISVRVALGSAAARLGIVVDGLISSALQRSGK